MKVLIKVKYRIFILEVKLSYLIDKLGSYLNSYKNYPIKKAV